MYLLQKFLKTRGRDRIRFPRCKSENAESETNFELAAWIFGKEIKRRLNIKNLLNYVDQITNNDYTDKYVG